MADTNDLDLLNRRIAADLLQALIAANKAVFGRENGGVIPETINSYHRLLAGIADDKKEA